MGKFQLDLQQGKSRGRQNSTSHRQMSDMWNMVCHCDTQKCIDSEKVSCKDLEKESSPNCYSERLKTNKRKYESWTRVYKSGWSCELEKHCLSYCSRNSRLKRTFAFRSFWSSQMQFDNALRLTSIMLHLSFHCKALLGSVFPVRLSHLHIAIRFSGLLYFSYHRVSCWCSFTWNP